MERKSIFLLVFSYPDPVEEIQLLAYRNHIHKIPAEHLVCDPLFSVYRTCRQHIRVHLYARLEFV